MTQSRALCVEFEQSLDIVNLRYDDSDSWQIRTWVYRWSRIVGLARRLLYVWFGPGRFSPRWSPRCLDDRDDSLAERKLPTVL
jgi:hypothetical protein